MPDLTPAQATDFQARLTQCATTIEAITLLAQARKLAGIQPKIESRHRAGFSSEREYLKDLRGRGLLQYTRLWESYQIKLKELLR